MALKLTEFRHFMALSGLILLLSCDGPQNSSQLPGRSDLGPEFLRGTGPLGRPAPAEAFTPRVTGPAANRFEGRLSLSMQPAGSRMDVIKDLFNRAGDTRLRLNDLPGINIQLVQDGNTLIPVDRARQAGGHPAWEWVLEAGQVWDEPGDNGWSRASLPFALVQRNANCTHNGLLTFLFKTDGSRVARGIPGRQ